MKALFIYSGSRADKSKGTPGADFPDTQFYGFNHLKELGIEADFKGRDDALPAWMLGGTSHALGRSLGRLLDRPIGFRVRHLLLYFAARKYDIVFGSSLIYMMIFKKASRIFKVGRISGGTDGPRFILLNIGLNRTLRSSPKGSLKRRVIESLLREFSAIVCLASVQKEWLEAECPFLKGCVFFVPLGADTAYYKPVYEGRSDCILSVGRDNGRDYGTLIEAARLLPDLKFEIVCSPRNLKGIGDTPGEPAIPGNVKVLFDLPFFEVEKKYRSARMLALTTHGDGWGDGSDCSGQTVLLDAMACGLPVIATRKKYLADYARSGEDILVAESGDAASLAEAIKKLSSDAALRSKLAIHSRAQAERLSTAAMARGLAGIFEIVMKG